jgi:hypothetical protein
MEEFFIWMINWLYEPVTVLDLLKLGGWFLFAQWLKKRIERKRAKALENEEIKGSQY